MAQRQQAVVEALMADRFGTATGDVKAVPAGPLRDWMDEVRAATDGRGATVVFDNIGAETWPQSLSLADRGARIVCSGTTGTPEVTLNLRNLYRNMNRFYFHMQGTSAELRTLVDVTGIRADNTRPEPLDAQPVPDALVVTGGTSLAPLNMSSPASAGRSARPSARTRDSNGNAVRGNRRSAVMASPQASADRAGDAGS